MSVGSAISSPLGPASCDKDAEAESEYLNGDRSPNLSAHSIPDSEFPTSVNPDEAVSSTTRLKPFHGVWTSLKKAVIKVGELIYKARDILLNGRGGSAGGGEGGDGEEGDVEGGDGEQGDLEGGDGDKKKLGATQKMLQLMATTTIANTAQTFGSAISLRDSGLTFSSKILLILVMATGLAGYLFSITAILLMHKSASYSRGLVWTGCAATTLGFLILIVAFVQEL